MSPFTFWSHGYMGVNDCGAEEEEPFRPAQGPELVGGLFATLPGARPGQPRGKARRLQRVLTDFGTEHSPSAMSSGPNGFGAGGARLREHFGFSLNASALRPVTLPFRQASRPLCQPKGGTRSGRRGRSRHALRRASAACRTRVPRPMGPWSASSSRAVRAPEPGPGSGRKCGCWRRRRRVRRGPPARRTFGSVAEPGGAGATARVRQAGLRSRSHVVADGAEWITLRSREVFGAQARVLTDFYHVSEYLAVAGQVCRARAPRTGLHIQPFGPELMAEGQTRLRRGALEPMHAELAAQLEPATVPDEAAPVRAAPRYLANRRDALDYAGD